MDCIIGTKVTWDYLRSLEGFSKKTYTLPSDKFPMSGVTVATGFDLGSKTIDDLRNAGMTEYSINRLMPFLGVKGEPANIIHKAAGPITLPDSQLNVLDNYSVSNIVLPNIALFNNQRKAGKIFNDLSQNIQSVIVHRAWHWGPYYGLFGSAPKKTFWIKIIHADFVLAAEVLEKQAAISVGGIKNGLINQAKMLREG